MLTVASPSPRPPGERFRAAVVVVFMALLATLAAANLSGNGIVKPLESISHGQPQPVALKADPAPAPTPPAPAVPTITFPANITGEIGDFLVIKAQTNCKNLKWIALKNSQGRKLKGLPAQLVTDPATVIVSSPKAGHFKLEVYGALGDGTLSDPVIVPVVVTDPDNPTPPPVPPTPPIPPAPPTPTATALWLVTIDDSTARTQQTAMLLGNLAYWEGIETAGHKWAHLDSANPEAAKFAKYTAGGLPVIVAMDMKGNVLQSAKLPVDTAAMDTMIKTLTGK